MLRGIVAGKHLNLKRLVHMIFPNRVVVAGLQSALVTDYTSRVPCLTFLLNVDVMQGGTEHRDCMT